MPANYIPTRCANPCPPVFIRVGISIQKWVDSYLDKTRLAALKIRSCLISNEQDQNVKLKASLQQADRKKNDCFSVNGFGSHCNTVLEAMGCFYHFCPCQELRPSLTEEDIQRGSKKRELDALRRHYIQEKGFKVREMWECECWRLYKTTKIVKQRIREHFPYKRSLAAEQLLEEIKKGKLFGYVQCDIEVPENWRIILANFLPIFKNISVSKSDIGDLMKNYAEEKNYCLNFEKCWHLASHYKMEHLLLLFCYFVQNRFLFAQSTPFFWVHPIEMLQQFSAVSSGRKKARWRKSKLKCHRSNNEASSQQLLRLPDHGSEPAHCNEVPHWQKNTFGY